MYGLSERRQRSVEKKRTILISKEGETKTRKINFPYLMYIMLVFLWIQIRKESFARDLNKKGGETLFITSSTGIKGYRKFIIYQGKQNNKFCNTTLDLGFIEVRLKSRNERDKGNEYYEKVVIGLSNEWVNSVQRLVYSGRVSPDRI